MIHDMVERAACFAIVSADYDHASVDLELLGTVSVHVLPTTVREQEDGYSPEDDAVASREEVELTAGVDFALAHAAQVEIELEGLGSFFIGERHYDGARPWPPDPPVWLRPFAPSAPWKRTDDGGPRLDWLVSVQAHLPPHAVIGPDAERQGWTVDTSQLDRFLAELAAAPVAPDGSRSLYTSTSPVVGLERVVTDATYAEAVRAPVPLTLPEGTQLLRPAAEPAGPGDRSWSQVIRGDTDVVVGTPAVDLATGAIIDAGTPARTSGYQTGGGQRPRYHLALADGRSTTVTQSQVLVA